MRGQARDYDHWAALTGDAGWRWDACLPLFRVTRTTGADAFTRARLRRELHGARRRVARRAPAPALGDPRRLRARRRSRPASRPPTTSTAATTRAWATSRSTSARRALERHQGLPAPGHAERPTCRCGPVRTALAAAGAQRAGARWTAIPRRGIEVLPHGGGAPVQCARARRGDPGHRRGRHAADPAALGHRAGVAAAASTACPWCTTLPGVGENLQDHLQIRAVFGRRRAHAQHAGQLLWGKARIGLEYLLQAQRADEHGAVAAGRLHAQRPGQRWPNVEYHVQPLSLDAFGEPLHRFPPSPPACATSTRPARHVCASARREPAARRRHPGQLPVDTRGPARWPPTRCA
jgi:choline dehydrogenase